MNAEGEAFVKALSFDYVSIKTRDLEKSVRFYSEVPKKSWRRTAPGRILRRGCSRSTVFDTVNDLLTGRR